MDCFLVLAAIFACVGIHIATKEWAEHKADEAYLVGFRLGRLQGRREARDLEAVS
jgi:hypothetical protein